MAESKFAQDQLAKYGWVSGSGLGKDEQGMKNPIKVSIKNNKKGVGHDPSKEFTDNWWDKLFNKAADSIVVNNTENGVDVTKVKTEEEDSKKESKKVLYGNFIKTSTLTNTTAGMEETPEYTEQPSDNTDVLTSKKYIVTDEEMFAKCGGRTAHKGARHGLNLNGKLKRIEEFEAKLLKQMQDKCSDDNKAKHKAKKKRKKDKVAGSDNSSDKTDFDQDSKETSRDTSNCDITDIMDVNGENSVVKEKKKKSKKKRKRKRKDSERNDDDDDIVKDNDIVNDNSESLNNNLDTVNNYSENDDIVHKKKKKKRKKETD